ncbi:MAG TPA: YhjD/YihY/BrkB family envelope integrity protein [Planctomycetota bacterium]|nr:YhjD/YihY/BrkB family envelope integrity protein [Planctomycetota bacterium]
MADQKPGIFSRIGKGYKRAETFIRRDLWLALPEARGPRLLYRLLRMGVLIVEGFIKTDVFMLSAALTYQVIFALVPLLVVMLAFVKALGGFASAGGKVQGFILHNILPRMGDGSVKGEGGADIAAQIDTFINNVNATAIGVIGGIALLYTSISLLNSIENVFNRIWGIKNARSILKRLMVYWTFLTLSPILLAASLSMTGVVQSNQLYVWLNTHVPYFGTTMLVLTPYVVAWVMFTGFYIFIPNTRVHPGAALIGALISGTAWEGMKTVYFWYNTHVVTNYKFYGSLGTIPVFLLWIYVSWIIVLFGAEIAFAVQHVNTYRREIEEARLSAADRDRLALVVCVEIVRPFIAGAKPPSGEEVATRLNYPVRAVNEILYELASQGVLRSVTLTDRKDAGYLPAKDPTLLTARDVVGAVRTFGDQGTLPVGAQAEQIYKLLDHAEGEAMGPLAAVTLRDLAARTPEAPPPSPAAEIRNPAVDKPVPGKSPA